MKKIKEGYKGVYDLFFTAVDCGEKWEIVFLKGKPGNNIAEGFAFDEPPTGSWEELENFFLRPEMAPFWLERNGYHVQKYFARMAAFWSFVPGAPVIPQANVSGMLQMPEFQAKLVAKFGINPEAYENY